MANPSQKGSSVPLLARSKASASHFSQRILESERRRCGQRGHWKAECPKRFEAEAKTTPAPTTFAGNVMIETEDGDTEADDMILISEADVSKMATCPVVQTVFCVDTQT